MLEFQTRIIDVVTKMLIVRKMPTYRAAVDVAVPRMMKPIAARSANKLAKGPRSRKRSDMIEVAIMTKKQSRYGGAEKPFDCSVEKAPSSEMMVGRNKGREAKLILQLKFIIAKK